MQKWFKKSTLGILWKFPHELSCQNLLNHYNYVDQDASRKIEADLCAAMIEMSITLHGVWFATSYELSYLNCDN